MKGKMSAEQKRKSAVKKKVRIYMENVREFIKSKNSGEIPLEWIGLLDMLEDYYKQYVSATLEIEALDSYLIKCKNGVVLSPLFKLQATSAMKVQQICAEFGLSMKQASKLNVKQPKKEESVLDAFFKGEIEKR